jgi:flagellar hook-length control protein FliK
LVRQLLRDVGKFADHRVAQVAAVISPVANTSAPSSSTSSGAQPSFGDDFAAVLAGLAPKTDLPKEMPPAPQQQQATQPVAQAKPIAAKSKPRVQAAAAPASPAAKPDTKIKAQDAKAPPASTAPDEAAPESDDAKDTVAAIAAPQPVDSSKIALAVRQFLAADTAKAVAPVPTDDDAQPQLQNAKPVSPDVLAKIIAAAKSTNAPAGELPEVPPKTGVAPKLPANVSVKVTSTPDASKAQPRPDAVPSAAVDKTERSLPDTAADARQDSVDSSAQKQTDDTQQQDASPPQHDAPQTDQAPAAAKPAPQPQLQAMVQAAPPAPPGVSAAAPATPASGPSPQAPADVPSSVAQLGTAIAVKAAGGAKSFEIRLDPAELGRVEVRLDVGSDGKADATITVHRPETLALLLSDSQNLERTLRDAGLDVSNSSLNFSLKGDGRQGDGGGASGALKRNLSDSVLARSEAANASIASQSLASPNARLDIRV